MGKQAPSTRHLAQLNATVGIGIARGERLERGQRVRLLRTGGLCQLAYGNRVGRNQKQRLEHAHKRALVYGFYLSHQ